MTLKIARQINVQDWMTSVETRTVFSALQGEGDHPHVLFVGGCVRNALLGRAVEDLDLATTFLPEEVTARLEAAGVRVVPTGLAHGTVTAVVNGRSFEITTLRRDVETDGRRAVVDYTECWLEDARRRDFTMNTLLMDARGAVYDPLGLGLADLEARVVRFVGDAAQRIAEDYLRILRFFRFHALYGVGEMDAKALAACAEGAQHPKMKALSRERVSQEFFKITASERAADTLCAMLAKGVLRALDFGNQDGVFRHVCAFQERYGLTALAARLFVYAGMDFKNIAAMERVMIFPKVFLKDMEGISGALTLSDLSCDSVVRVAVYRFGRVATAQALMIELAQDRVMNHYAPRALEIIQTWDVPDFPLSGKDILAMGVEEGARIGEILHDAEEWWIGQDFAPDRAACLEKLRGLCSYSKNKT